MPDAFDGAATVETVVATLQDLVQDWEIDEPIDETTRVVADLGFESVDLIQMVGALEQAFGLHGTALVDMLVANGRYVDDLTVAQIAAAVDVRLARNKGR